MDISTSYRRDQPRAAPLAMHRREQVRNNPDVIKALPGRNLRQDSMLYMKKRPLPTTARSRPCMMWSLEVDGGNLSPVGAKRRQDHPG